MSLLLKKNIVNLKAEGAKVPNKILKLDGDTWNNADEVIYTTLPNYYPTSDIDY